VRTVGADHRRCRTFRSADAAPPTGARADAASARSSASIMCPQNPPTSIFRATCTCAPRPRHARARGREWAARARTFFGSGESPQTSQTVWPSESGEAHSTSTRSSSTSNSSGLARGTRRAARARASARPASRAEGDSSEGGGREPEHRRDGTGVMERRVWHAEHAVVGALEEGEQLHHQRAERRAPAAPRGRRHAHAPRAARRARGGAEASLRGGRCQGRALCAAPGSGGGADGRAGGAEAAPKGRAGGT